MHRLSPADELAEIRAEIARLKAREAMLRTIFLRQPDAQRQGRWARVEVVETCQKRFNPALLPEDGPERRFAQGRHGAVAPLHQPLGQPDGVDRLARVAT